MPHHQALVDQRLGHVLEESRVRASAQLGRPRLYPVSYSPRVADRHEFVVESDRKAQKTQRIGPRQVLHQPHHVDPVLLFECPNLAFRSEAKPDLANGLAAVLEDALSQLIRADRRVYWGGVGLGGHAGIISAVAKKSLGQHFLADAQVVTDILQALELQAGDRVLEIGPGQGVLTHALVHAGAEVTAVELDQDLIADLRRLPIRVIHDDILHVDVGALMRGAGVLGNRNPALGTRYKVAGNIPYYISSAILRHLLEARPQPHQVVLMLQKELAERVVAAPGEMSLLSVSVQVYGRPRIVREVPAHAFRPPPKVDSAVLRIDVYPRPAVPLDDPDAFFAVVRAGFAERRKQVHNALQRNYKPGGAHTKAPLDAHAVTQALRDAGVDPMRRAETLTLGEWASITHVVRELPLVR